MQTVRLGKTDIVVSKNGFGCLPIQRISFSEASYLLNKALDNGINYFDTARAYSDSEEKMGLAFEGKRDRIVISTKSMATDKDKMISDLEESLRKLKTDYIDIYQLHNPAFCPKPGDGTGLYEALLKAKEEGKIRHIGITNHRLIVANEIIDSDLYETIQFPFCYLATDKDIALVNKAKQKDMGFICMKGLSGGLITNSKAAYAYIAQFDNTAPIWGIQKESELDEFLSYNDTPPTMDNEDIIKTIEKDRVELSSSFCRSCGYCMSECPEHIQINQCARMSLLLRRSPSQNWLTKYWQDEMKKIENCRNCGRCATKCPYSLDTPRLLRENYEDYKTFLN